MKKFLLGIVLAIFLFSGTAFGMADKWKADYNATGISECAIEVIKKIVINDEYDWIVARFDPKTLITGSGCTVDGGTTSFPSADNLWWYPTGGVTLNPWQFKMNEVLTYWFSEEVDAGTEGTSGNSPYFRYEWVSNLGSGNTDWKVKVFYIDAAMDYVEISAVAGSSTYVGPDSSFTYFGSATLLDTAVTHNPVSNSSTTFWPTHYVGWGSGVTPIINVIGKR